QRRRSRPRPAERERDPPRPHDRLERRRGHGSHATGRAPAPAPRRRLADLTLLSSVLSFEALWPQAIPEASPHTASTREPRSTGTWERPPPTPTRCAAERPCSLTAGRSSSTPGSTRAAP